MMGFFLNLNIHIHFGIPQFFCKHVNRRKKGKQIDILPKKNSKESKEKIQRKIPKKDSSSAIYQLF